MNPVRRNAQCPYCRRHSSTFVARSSNGAALYRCNETKGKARCGRWFEAAHPKPLPRAIVALPYWLAELIAGRAS